MIADRPSHLDSPAGRIWLMTALALVVLGAWMSRFGPEPTADDFGQYLMHAQAVLDGRGYSDIDYLFSHYAWGTGPPISAPGFTLTLVPVLATVGYGDWVHTIGMLFAIALLAVVTARYFGRWDPVHGAAAAYVVVVALILLRAGSTLYPDVPFAVLCWTVVLLADGEDSWGWSRTLAIALIGVAALLYRTAGVALIPSMLLFGVLSFRSRGFKPLIQVAVWALAFWIIFTVFEAGQFPAPPPDFVDLPDAGNPTIWDRMIKNGLSYRWPLFDLQLYPFPTRLMNAAYHVGITLISAWALTKWMSGALFRYGVIFLFAYVGMLLVAPVQSGRYFWPLFPFAAFAMVRGLDGVLNVGRLARASSAVRIMVPLGALTFLAVIGIARNPPPEGLMSRESVQALFGELRQEADRRPETRVVFVKPRTLSWYTGVPAMAQFNPPTDAVVFSELESKAITHVVLGSLGQHDAAEKAWRDIVAGSPGLFDLQYSNDDFELYAFRSAAR